MMTINNSTDLLQLIPARKFTALAKKWEVDKGVVKLNAERLVSALLSAAVFNHQSLRETEYSTGIPKSTLADALARRPVGFFEELVNLCLSELLPKTSNRKTRSAIRTLIALDASICQVHGSLSKFKEWKAGKNLASIKFHAAWNVESQWIEQIKITGKRRNDAVIGRQFSFKPGATYVMDRGYWDAQLWLKIKSSGAHFVTRVKRCGCRLAAIHKSIGDDINKISVIHDGVWMIGEDASYRLGIKVRSVKFRHIVYRDPETLKLFDFITSDFEASAQEVANIYRKRWAVELLFRWLKGHLYIRRLPGRNKNAIKIQIIAAVLTQLLTRLMLQISKTRATTWELLRWLRTAPERHLRGMPLNKGFPVVPPMKRRLGANCGT